MACVWAGIQLPRNTSTSSDSSDEKVTGTDRTFTSTS